MAVEVKRILKDTVGISGFHDAESVPAAVVFDLIQVTAPNTYNIGWRIAAARGSHAAPFEKRSLIGVVPDSLMLIAFFGLAAGGKPDIAIEAKLIYNAAASAAPGAIGVVSSRLSGLRH
jgi:hypothetical protein